VDDNAKRLIKFTAMSHYSEEFPDGSVDKENIC